MITVKEQLAVQSFGYNRYLPIGRPEIVAENLERWGADEIVVLSIDRKNQGLGPDLKLIEKIAHHTSSTPLIYGGGIRSLEDALSVIEAGVERICIDSLLRDNQPIIHAISSYIGAQALIGSLPLLSSDAELLWYNYENATSSIICDEVLQLFSKNVVSEALIIDFINEGCRNSFDLSLIERFPKNDIPLIAFGGISEPKQIEDLISHRQVCAVCVGNFLNYKEHSIQYLKNNLSSQMPIRPPLFQDSYTSF